MSHVPTVEFRTELNLTGRESTVVGRRYRTLRTFILHKCKEARVTSKRQCGEATWNKLRTDAVPHPALQGFQAKFKSPRDGTYIIFHKALDSLIADVLKKAVESRKAARMNSDDEEEESIDGPSGTQYQVTIVRPPPTLYEEKPIRIMHIDTTSAPPGTAYSLP